MGRLMTRRGAMALWGCLGIALSIALGLWVARLVGAFETTTSALSTTVIQEPPGHGYFAPRPTPSTQLPPGGECQRIMGVTGEYVYLSVKTGSLLSPAQARNC